MLVHSFVLRQVSKGDVRNQLSFCVNGVDVRFHPFKFAFITSLHFSRFSDFEMYIPLGAGDRVQGTYFRDMKIMRCIALEQSPNKPFGAWLWSCTNG